MINKHIEVFKECPQNSVIYDSLDHTLTVLKNNNNIAVSISGGSDSDILIDLVEKFRSNQNITYVFYDTGIEFKYTKEHLFYLEDKYNISIERITPKMTIPSAVLKEGQPFLSKYTSEMLGRLQKHNFDFYNPPETFEEAYSIYTKCKIALMWFYNANPTIKGKGDTRRPSTFNIERNRYLREYILENPPTFKISGRCCYHVKKKVSDGFIKQSETELNIVGIRKSEGGVRTTNYKGCYSEPSQYNKYKMFRPLFWYTDKDKEEYNNYYKIKNSKLYTEHGFTSTGCSCCPFAKGLDDELKFTEKYDPQLYKAVNNIFKDTYEYTRGYYEYLNKRKKEK